MREIKFRAWDTLKSSWVEKAYSCITFIGRIFGLELDGDKYYLEAIGRDDRYILMQYTGLKDSKGTEIYEGDVVTADIEGVDEKSDVTFEDGCFVIKARNQDPHYTPCLCIAQKLEVIGNIYENPELLEEPPKEERG